MKEGTVYPQSPVAHPACVIFIAILSLQPEIYAFAQPTGPSVNDSATLVLEQLKSHKQVVLSAGKTVSYKTFDSKHFLAATIIAITDSTISFDTKRKGHTTLRYDEIAALKLRNKELQIAGAVAVGTGLIILANGLGYEEQTVATLIPSTILVGTGLGLMLNKKMFLTKSWEGQTVSYVDEANHGVKGTIKAVTDSTITIENRKTNEVSTLSDRKAMFKIKRDKLMGTILIGIGVAGLVATAALGGGYAIPFVGFPSVIALTSALILRTSGKKVKLDKTWRVQKIGS
jgi:hypothetical protein